MRAKLIGGFAAVVLMVAGSWGYARWQTTRLAACEERGAQLATLPILDQQPAGMSPDGRYSGCDIDRAISYAGIQFAGRFERAALITFTEQAAARDGWRSTGAPGTGDNPAAFCGEREIGGRTIYLRTMFPAFERYEVHLSEHADSGAFCG
jgi:hypothetical protein